MLPTTNISHTVQLRMLYSISRPTPARQ